MLILAIADLLTRQPRLLNRVAINQALVGTLGVCLMVIAVLGVLAGGGVGAFPLGWSSGVIGFGYVAGMRLLHRNRAKSLHFERLVR